jgi:voltage-gated potassium channel
MTAKPGPGLTARRRAYEIVQESASGDLVSRLFDRAIVWLIIVNVVAVVLETVDWIGRDYGDALWAFEVVSVAIFTAEYAVRLWVAPEHAPFGRLTPGRARLAWVVTPGAIIDILAIAPFYLWLLLPFDLRFLRIFRLIRFFKLVRYSSGLVSLFRALYNERRALIGCVVIMFGLVLTAASLMHFAEREAQPDKFGSIPAAMWWAVATLTTTGYGDVVPLTPIGKILGGVTMIMGLAMFALPVGIVATAFANEIHRREFVITWGLVARVPLFRGLDAEEVAEIMSLLHARLTAAGEVITRKGEAADCMYFIVSGEVDVDLGGGERVALGEGAFFGEIALLKRTRRSATIVTRGRTQLLVLNADDFHRLVERRPDIGLHIRQVAEARAATVVKRGGDLAAEELGE